MNHQDSEIPTDESSLILFVLFELHYFMCKQESLSLSFPLARACTHTHTLLLCKGVLYEHKIVVASSQKQPES